MAWLDWAGQRSPELAGLVERDPIVVVPVGSVEQHGNHLPVGTDAFAAEAVARAAADDWAGERPLLLLPTIWAGLSPHHMGLPGSITLRSETFLAVVEDVCSSLLHHGVRRVVLLNGHGGNMAALDVALTRLGERGLDVARVVAVTYWHLVAHRVEEFRDSREGGMGHAGEFESSLMLATHADRVALGEAATLYPDLGTRYLTTDLFGTGIARRFVPFDELSPTGTLGDPSVASREKGERILRICAEELGRFLADVAGW